MASMLTLTTRSDDLTERLYIVIRLAIVCCSKQPVYCLLCSSCSFYLYTPLDQVHSDGICSTETCQLLCSFS